MDTHSGAVEMLAVVAGEESSSEIVVRKRIHVTPGTVAI